MKQSQHFYIDIQEILCRKAPQTAKKIPSFVIKALAKLLHQDDINQLIKDNEDVTGVEFMNRMVDSFHFRLNVVGEDNLPDFDTPCIFASNHPLGGADGICLSSFLGNHYNRRIKYIVNDLLYFIEPLKPIFVPVNRLGEQGRGAATMLNEAFASPNQILTFPAGICSRKIKGKICDLEWRKMLVVKAIEYQRDIVPVYFDAKNSDFFYSIANLRQQLKLKFNIEMLFLPHELFKSKNKTFTIRFGKPIPWQTFDSSKNPQQWTDWVKQTVYDLVRKN
ncbi:MAG: glycerol acyltransferase [Candidatus Azobacteroides sp.]|nr:glycerol acyltransferase [Candidatus Azobacteroides sp.]